MLPEMNENDAHIKAMDKNLRAALSLTQKVSRGYDT